MESQSGWHPNEDMKMRYAPSYRFTVRLEVRKRARHTEMEKEKERIIKEGRTKLRERE